MEQVENFNWLEKVCLGAIYEPDPKKREECQKNLKYLVGDYEILFDNNRIGIYVCKEKTYIYITNVPEKYPKNEKLEIYLNC